MDGLHLKTAEKEMIFTPDGKTSVVAGGGSTVRGTWETQSSDDTLHNKISYTIDGADQTPVPVNYQFNDNNQLVATIPAASNTGNVATTFTFVGKIAIDDNHDLVYSLLDDKGNPL